VFYFDSPSSLQTFLTCHEGTGGGGGGCEVIAVLILDLGCIWEWMVNVTCRPLLPRRRATVPFVR
jgi:hypothetical protein